MNGVFPSEQIVLHSTVLSCRVPPRTYPAISYGKYNINNDLEQVINITKGKTFKKCSILSRGLLDSMHPHGVFKRYHDYVIFDFNVRVIFEYRINYAYR